MRATLIAPSLSCFNPRLRTGGDAHDGGHHGHTVPVSIHASAREATGGWRADEAILPVSIHASAREATLSVAGMRTAKVSFNPRLRTGGDPCS